VKTCQLRGGGEKGSYPAVSGCQEEKFELFEGKKRER